MNPALIYSTVIALICCAACSSSADLSAVNVESAKTVKRYDIVQTLGSNGQVVVAGTQSGAALKSTDGGKTWSRETLCCSSSV